MRAQKKKRKGKEEKKKGNSVDRYCQNTKREKEGRYRKYGAQTSKDRQGQQKRKGKGKRREEKERTTGRRSALLWWPFYVGSRRSLLASLRSYYYDTGAKGATE